MILNNNNYIIQNQHIASYIVSIHYSNEIISNDIKLIKQQNQNYDIIKSIERLNMNGINNNCNYNNQQTIGNQYRHRFKYQTQQQLQNQFQQQNQIYNQEIQKKVAETTGTGYYINLQI